MKLIGKIIKDTRIIKEAVSERNEDNADFRDMLEACFIEVCKELDIPVPLWLKKNSKEFGAYRRTFFSREQFLEQVDFDRFDLRIEI